MSNGVRPLGSLQHTSRGKLRCAGHMTRRRRHAECRAGCCNSLRPMILFAGPTSRHFRRGLPVCSRPRWARTGILEAEDVAVAAGCQQVPAVRGQPACANLCRDPPATMQEGVGIARGTTGAQLHLCNAWQLFADNLGTAGRYHTLRTRLLSSIVQKLMVV